MVAVESRNNNLLSPANLPPPPSAATADHFLPESSANSIVIFEDPKSLDKKTQIEIYQKNSNNSNNSQQILVDSKTTQTSISPSDSNNDNIIGDKDFGRRNYVDTQEFNSFISDDPSSKTIFNRARFENQYKVLNDLGRGSFGRVYSAISYIDNQIYAVKEIKTYNDPTVFNEARIFSHLSKIYHPNVVRYYGSWVELKHNWKKVKKSFNLLDPSEHSEHSQNSSQSLISNDDNFLEFSPNVLEAANNAEHITINDHNNNNDLILHLYIQMEYCDLSLDNWLVERNQTSDIPSAETYNQCISISKQLISAMAFIHDNHIIHLDFRPSNIFVKKGETIQVKIGDFGLSVSPSSHQNAISPNNMGSYYYLSPESEISEKKDIFAIGVTLYEVFTKFTTAAERHYVLKSIKEECSLPSSDKSFYLFWQISKMVSRDPLDRPDLHEILDSYSLEDEKAATESLIVEGSQENAVELQRLRTRVKFLESVLLENGIKCP